MAEYADRDRFIPFRKREIVEMILKDKGLSQEEEPLFKDFCKILEALYHFFFHKDLEELKDYYFPFNPDKDTKSIRQYTKEELQELEKKLVEKFRQVLNDANFEELTEEDIQYALEEESLFNISLYIDFEDFDSYLIFRRGDVVKKEQIPWLWIFKKTVEVPTYERVALLFKFKDEQYFRERKRKNIKFAPGSMIIKLFKNVPKADLEMLFPNTQVRMRLRDKLIIGGTFIGGGIGVLLKAGAGLIALVTVVWYLVTNFMKSGNLPELTNVQIAQMVGGVTALGVILGFLWRQWTNYKNRTIQFMKALTDNLYFKNLDNNEGVFHRIIDAAEEEEFKEAVLGYYFLLKAKEPLTARELDDRIEEWLEKEYNTKIDFEIQDAMEKLLELELLEEKGSRNGEKLYQALPLIKACERLDYLWDNFFTYNRS